MKLTRELLQNRKEMSALLRDLWQSLIPEFTPNESQFFLWLDRYGAEIAERAVRVTGTASSKRRALGQPMDADSLVRYASGTMRHMERDSA